MAETLGSTPRALGFRMAGRVGSGTRLHGWRGRITAKTGRESSGRFRGSMRRLCDCWQSRERVRLLVQDAAAEKRATGILKRAGANLAQVELSRVATNRVVAARLGADLREGFDRQAEHYRFGISMRGPSIDDWQLDDLIPKRAAELLDLPHGSLRLS